MRDEEASERQRVADEEMARALFGGNGEVDGDDKNGAAAEGVADGTERSGGGGGGGGGGGDVPGGSGGGGGRVDGDGTKNCCLGHRVETTSSVPLLDFNWSANGVGGAGNRKREKWTEVYSSGSEEGGAPRGEVSLLD